jgi:phospholipase C
VRPYVDHSDVNGGGPHGVVAAQGDIDGGKMDGFVRQRALASTACTDPNDPACATTSTPDVLGYHTQSDIPNYWAYARNFVLQDHMFEPDASWSLPAHLFTVSEWSAVCTQHLASSCTNNIEGDQRPKYYGIPTAAQLASAQPIYAWTDMTYLFHKDNVSWGYYVVPGSEPDCRNDAAETCAPIKQNAKTPSTSTTSTPRPEPARYRR